MSDKDDGRTEVALTQEGGKVVLRFPRPRQWVAFDPENAVALAEGMSRAAYQTRFGHLANPNGPAPAMTQQIRDRLVNTVALMIASMQRDGKPPRRIAEEMVDHILSRVT